MSNTNGVHAARKHVLASLKIEQGVPLPPKNGAPAETIAELVRRLKVKESVLFPNSHAKSVYVYGYQCIGRGKYAVRKMSNGYRLWRTK